MPPIAQLLHVARFELAARRGLILYAAIPSIALPFTLLHPREATDGALGVALASGLVAALVLGASMLATDLVEGRLGFYLARPLSPLAFWGGKVLAATGVSLLTVVVVVLPCLVVAGEAARELPRMVLFGAPALLALVLLGHVAAVAARSRSLWWLLDASALAITGVLVAWLLRGLRGEGLMNFHLYLLPAGTGLIAGGLLGGYAQVRWGGVDPKRSHRLLSMALCSALLLGIGGSLLLTLGALRVTPAELAPWRKVAAGGDWLAVDGAVGRPGDDASAPALDDRLRVLNTALGAREDSSRFPYAQGDDWRGGWLRFGYHPSFLVHLPSGQAHRLPHAEGPALVASSGRFAAWLTRDPDGDLALVHARLPEGAQPLQPVTTDARVGPATQLLALSPDGRWLIAGALPLEVAPGRARLLVFDLAHGARSPARFELPIPERYRAEPATSGALDQAGLDLEHHWSRSGVAWRDDSRADLVLHDSGTTADGATHFGQSVFRLELVPQPRFARVDHVVGNVFFGDGRAVLFTPPGAGEGSLRVTDYLAGTSEDVALPAHHTVIAATLRDDGSIVALLEEPGPAGAPARQRLATLRPNRLPPVAAPLSPALVVKRVPWHSPAWLFLEGSALVASHWMHHPFVVDLEQGTAAPLAAPGLGRFPRLLGRGLVTDETGAIHRLSLDPPAVQQLVPGCRPCS